MEIVAFITIALVSASLAVLGSTIVSLIGDVDKLYARIDELEKKLRETNGRSEKN